MTDRSTREPVTEAGKRMASLLYALNLTDDPDSDEAARDIAAIEQESAARALAEAVKRVGAILLMPSSPRRWYCAWCGEYETHAKGCRAAAVLAALGGEEAGSGD